MKLLICTSLATMLFAATAVASESTTSQSLKLPDTMTVSGEQFASRCTDQAFAKATSRKWLADQCDAWLQRWQQEARCQDVANASRLDCVMINDGKPSASKGLAPHGSPMTPSTAREGRGTGRAASR